MKRETSYSLSLFCFLLALLAKTAVVPLPGVFLLITWWRSGRITRRDIARTLPFFALALTLGLVTIWFQYQYAIGDHVVREDSFLSRLAISGWAVWFYLSKAFLPIDLAFVYPRWEADTANPLTWLPLLLLAALTLALWQRRARPACRGALVALAAFVAMLFPILGFFDIFFMKYSLVADHWQYFSIPAAIAALTAFLAAAAKRRGKPVALAAVTLTAVAIATLATLTWRQAGDYKDEETLWRRTIARNPAAWLAYYNLGVILHNSDRLDEAAAKFLSAIAVAPDEASPYLNLGLVRFKQGRIQEAITQYRRAIDLDPKYAKAHSNLAIALRREGRLDEAIAHYRSALEADPGFTEARYNYAIALAHAGHSPEAAAQYRRVLAADPTLAEAHTNLALIDYRQGRIQEAIAGYRRAIALRPDFSMAHNNLALALRDEGRLDEALAHYRSALEADPGFVQARFNYAAALEDANNFPEAIAQYRQILVAGPDLPGAHTSLALALFHEGQAPEARVHLEKALALRPDDPAFLRTLAAATAETGDFAKAIEIAGRAITLAEKAANPELAALLRQDQDRYRAHSPAIDR